MTRVLCIGEAMIELIMNGPQAMVGVAGDSLNTAIYLKRMAPEIHVDYLTCLGDDPFSDQIAGFIAGEQIGTGQISRLTDGSPGLYAITTDAEGERTFTYWRSNSAARSLFTDSNFSAVDKYDYVYLSGISVAILPAQISQGFLHYLRNTQAQVIFDSNYRPRLWDSVETARDVIRGYWEAADIALPSIDDEMALFAECAAEVERRWQASTATGALKRGVSGPMSIGAAVDQSYTPAAAVLDTTAAGDSFNGGYLAARLTGADQAAALLAGHALASRVVQHRGAIIPRDALPDLQPQ